MSVSQSSLNQPLMSQPRSFAIPAIARIVTAPISSRRRRGRRRGVGAVVATAPDISGAPRSARAATGGGALSHARSPLRARRAIVPIGRSAGTEDAPRRPRTESAGDGGSRRQRRAAGPRARVRRRAGSPCAWSLLLVTGVSLYLLLPSLLEVFSSWPELREVNPIWIVPRRALRGGELRLALDAPADRAPHPELVRGRDLAARRERGGQRRPRRRRGGRGDPVRDARARPRPRRERRPRADRELRRDDGDRARAAGRRARRGDRRRRDAARAARGRLHRRRRVRPARARRGRGLRLRPAAPRSSGGPSAPRRAWSGAAPASRTCPPACCASGTASGARSPTGR